MKSKVDVFFEWFEKLSEEEKAQIIAAITDNNTLLQRGRYSGPMPVLLNEGRFSGPAPIYSSTPKRVCKECGRVY